MQKIVLLLSSLFFVSCTQVAKKQSQEIPKENPGHSLSQEQSIQLLQKQLNKQAMMLEMLKNENQQLRRKSLQQNIAEKETGRSSSNELKNLEGSLGETKLFGSFINAMNTKREKKANRAFELLSKAYPNSSYLAEAHYIRGKSYLERKQSKAALKEFETLIKNFPQHDRARSALLAKAIIYRRLNLLGPSNMVLDDIIKRYPHSEEAKKAVAHRKLMEMAVNKVEK